MEHRVGLLPQSPTIYFEARALPTKKAEIAKTTPSSDESVARPMRSKPSKTPSSFEQPSDEPSDQFDYLCTAANLLEQMFAGLKGLAVVNPDFDRSFSLCEPDAADDLSRLRQTIERLRISRDGAAGRVLARRARTLIAWLAEEFEALMLSEISSNALADCNTQGLH